MDGQGLLAEDVVERGVSNWLVRSGGVRAWLSMEEKASSFSEQGGASPTSSVSEDSMAGEGPCSHDGSTSQA